MAAHRNRAFTLAEILVASTISAFVALVAAGALKTVSDSAKKIDEVGEMTSEVRFATRMLSRDLNNLYRDQDARNMLLVGAGQGSDESKAAYLKFWAVGRAGARDNQPEGDIYEIEYVLGQNMTSEAADDPDATRSILFRRLWPNPDRNRPPGGVVTPIAENIDVFQIRFFDGQQWTSDWPEEMQSIPELIEVTLVTLSAESKTPTAGTFMMSFPRLATETPPASDGSNAQPGSNGPGQPGNVPNETGNGNASMNRR